MSDGKARGTRLVFTVLPKYDPDEPASHFDPLRRLAREESIPFLSHYGDTTFTGKRCFFHDGYHLNRKGAEAYTKVIASELKGLLKEGS